jgi:hypothetical protein
MTWKRLDSPQERLAVLIVIGILLACSLVERIG